MYAKRMTTVDIESHMRDLYDIENMANKKLKEKHKPTRKTLRDNEFYNPKTKRYEYRYKDVVGKARVISSYKLDPTDQVPVGKKSGKM